VKHLLSASDLSRDAATAILDDADKFDAMAAADALIMPSYFESLSMVALEAWALGRPVLANAKCDVLKGQCIRSNAGLYYDSEAEFVETLRAVNPRAKLILTVSPVPLAASASGNHVLPATIYSKSALRAAAQEAAEDLENVFYFPSYEIITGPQARGRFFAEDLREVTEKGVEHVMRVFLRHAAGLEAPVREQAVDPAADDFTAGVAWWVETMCDEAMLDGENA